MRETLIKEAVVGNDEHMATEVIEKSKLIKSVVEECTVYSCATLDDLRTTIERLKTLLAFSNGLQ